MTVCSKTVEIPVALLFVMGVLRLKHISFGRIAGSRGPSQAIITFLLLPCCLPLSYRAPPLIQDSPFIWGWNAPTELCAKRFNVTLDLRFFDFIGSPRKEMKGQNITIFYEYRLGHYPYIDETTSKLVNGGIPQEADLRSHLIKAENDISCCMNDNQIGLAVIDWENWRPLWDRNWKPKDIYRNASVAVVQKRNANLDINEVTKIAKNDFETAAKNFMEETIKLGRLLQPSYLWGYYLFPECYNSHYRKPGYDGSCPEIEMRRNDHLHWLWKESTALYPSIYLNRFLQSSALTPLYVRHRVLEAVRISKAHHDKNPLPVFIYTRPVLTDRSLQFLAQVNRSRDGGCETVHMCCKVDYSMS
ncbi:hyaluronidase PH-20-like [Rhynchocyon petersi]